MYLNFHAVKNNASATQLVEKFNASILHYGGQEGKGKIHYGRHGD